ncbi:uncharacterized protein AUP68_16562 [Ilyonectria robusta]
MASAPDIPPTAFVETMNPERAWMLAEVAREEAALPPVVVKKENLPPPASGANCAPVGDASSRATRDREKTHQMKLVGNDSVEVISAQRQLLTLSTTLLQRPKPGTQLLRVRLPPVNKPPVSSKRSHAEFCEERSHKPALPLLPPMPKLSDIPSLGPGVIHRSVEGELLEDVWAGLSSQMKRHYARQLRKIVDGMRGVVCSDGRGSVQAGEYTLFLDKHTNHTYYAVRRYTSPKQFMAFLLSSFYKTVPKKVALAFIAPLKVKGRQLLSHCALCPKNIIVNEGKIAWILGWDCAGYYPGWWDYVKFFEARTRPENLDWYDYAGEIFSAEYPLQLVAYQGLTRCQQL